MSSFNKFIAAAGADIVMLDNTTPAALAAAAKTVKARNSPSFWLMLTATQEQYPHVLVEGSGGLSEETLHQYMLPSLAFFLFFWDWFIN